MCKHLCCYIRENKEGNESEIMLLQTLSPKAKQAVLATPCVMPKYPLILPPSVPAAAKSLQLYPTLRNPIDGSPPSSPIPGIL